jgi:hypothetical protein
LRFPRLILICGDCAGSEFEIRHGVAGNNSGRDGGANRAAAITDVDVVIAGGAF